MNTQLQPCHTQTHRSANTDYKNYCEGSKGGKMQEQLASWRGIWGQKRICWHATPAATAECLFKQPIKPSAQVGTISPQTISLTCQVWLPRQNWDVALLSLTHKQKHTGMMKEGNVQKYRCSDECERQCMQINRFTVHMQWQSLIHQDYNFTHHGVTNDSGHIFCKCSWLLWQQSVTSRLQTHCSKFSSPDDLWHWHKHCYFFTF